jgi:hypothetical protein
VPGVAERRFFVWNGLKRRAPVLHIPGKNEAKTTYSGEIQAPDAPPVAKYEVALRCEGGIRAKTALSDKPTFSLDVSWPGTKPLKCEVAAFVYAMSRSTATGIGGGVKKQITLESGVPSSGQVLELGPVETQFLWIQTPGSTGLTLSWPLTSIAQPGGGGDLWMLQLPTGFDNFRGWIGASRASDSASTRRRVVQSNGKLELAFDGIPELIAPASDATEIDASTEFKISAGAGTKFHRANVGFRAASFEIYFDDSFSLPNFTKLGVNVGSDEEGSWTVTADDRAASVDASAVDTITIPTVEFITTRRDFTLK